MKKSFFILCLFPTLFIAQTGNAQNKLELNGYLVNMQSVAFAPLPDSLNSLPKNDNTFYNVNLFFQNRLNLFWYATDHLTISAQMRNRLLIGDQVRTDFSNQVENSYRYSGNLLNTSWNVAVGNTYIVNLAFDRIYAEYTSGDLEVTIGKQRINWGKTFGFNPNDMFNTYSYFDFDYEEKPGTDAVRAMYYTGAATSLEVAANIDSAQKISAAARWNANVLNYDLQVIGGVLKNDDFALGLGWSGYVGGASWRGEFGYYHPFENFADTSGIAMLSSGMDYSINGEWMVQAEMMFAKLPDNKKAAFTDPLAAPQSVKDLANSPFQLLASVNYQASPLSSFALASIWYPHKDIQGIYLGPSWTYSIADNFSAAFYWQFFHGYFPDTNSDDLKKQSYNAGYLRLKYSF